MVTSPTQVVNLITGMFRPEVVTKARRDIERNLNDAKWVADWRQGTNEDPYWSMAFSGTLTQGEMDQLTSDYSHAGWGFVKITNSEGNGERPGMWGIKLYKNSRS